MGASRDGAISFAEGAVTRADIEYSYARRHSDHTTHVPLEQALHASKNLSLVSGEKAHQYLDDKGQAHTAVALLKSRLRYVFGSPPSGEKRRKKAKSTKFWIKPEPFRVRKLENAEDDDDGQADDYDVYMADDDDAGMKNDDDYGKNQNNDDFVSAADERCSAFLVSFLEGTTDAHDTCEGMMNAYTAAGKCTRSP